MKKSVSIVLCVLLAVPVFCSCLSSGRPAATEAPDATEAPAVYTNTAYPVEIRYDRSWLDPAFAKTRDRYTIDDLLEALGGLRVTGTTAEGTDDKTDIIRLIYDGGAEETFEFESGLWIRDGVRYTVEGYNKVADVLDSMMEHFGGCELPSKFTGTPCVDDADGYYRIFFGGGYGLGCGAFFTGFDGEWFENGTLFTWGVFDDVLHVFPQGGDERQYPVSYGEKTIRLGDMPLSETYPQELNALCDQWTGIGRRIEAELGQ